MKSSSLFNSCVLVTASDFKYIITQSPDPNNLQNYKDFLLTNCVSSVVKLCSETKYDIEFLNHYGIEVKNMPLLDGGVPTNDEIKEWITIIKKAKKDGKKGIASHCMSGYGRACVFACVALIKVEGIDPVDSIIKIRKEIPRSLNTVQINFLKTLSCDRKRIGCIIC
jgi:protein-tyrosine phosphatase